MWSYFILYFCVAGWILIDAKKREYNGIAYAIISLFLGPLVAPVYLAKRNLKEGETREGGTPWNILKNFALFWTLTVFILGVSWFFGMIAVSNSIMTRSPSEPGVAAGAAVGAAFGTLFIFGILASIWFFPMIFALILGMFLKKSSEVEVGPTGNLSIPTRTVTTPPVQKKVEPPNKGKPVPMVSKKTKKNWVAIGRKHFDAKEYKEAIIALDGAVKADPKDKTAYYIRAAAYNRLSDRKNALEDIKAAARLGHPKAVEYLQNNVAL